MPDPQLKRKHWQRQIIYPSTVGRIVVTYPGFFGSIKGFNRRYEELAERISREKAASVVLCNHRLAWIDLAFTINRMLLRYQIREHLESIRENSKEICGSEKPWIMAVGTSAGSGALAAIAYKYPSVQRLVLFSPSFDAGKAEVLDGISQFTGELYILYGQWDVFIGRPTAPQIFQAAKNATFKRQIMVPRCDHSFRGRTNRRWCVDFPVSLLHGKPIALE